MTQQTEKPLTGAMATVGLIFLLAGTVSPFVLASGHCSVNFSGTVETGPPTFIFKSRYALSSTPCTVTSSTPGAMIGTFAGTFTSEVISGSVSGTWSINSATGTQKVMASGAGFTVQISLASLPSPGLTFQGTLSVVGAGAPFLLTGTAGAILLS